MKSDWPPSFTDNSDPPASSSSEKVELQSRDNFEWPSSLREDSHPLPSGAAEASSLVKVPSVPPSSSDAPPAASPQSRENSHPFAPGANVATSPSKAISEVSSAVTSKVEWPASLSEGGENPASSAEVGTGKFAPASLSSPSAVSPSAKSAWPDGLTDEADTQVSGKGNALSLDGAIASAHTPALVGQCEWPDWPDALREDGEAAAKVVPVVSSATIAGESPVASTTVVPDSSGAATAAESPAASTSATMAGGVAADEMPDTSADTLDAPVVSPSQPGADATLDWPAALAEEESSGDMTKASALGAQSVASVSASDPTAPFVARSEIVEVKASEMHGDVGTGSRSEEQASVGSTSREAFAKEDTADSTKPSLLKPVPKSLRIDSTTSEPSDLV